MDKSVETCLLEMELGAGQSYANMAVFELLRPLNGGPEYITLREALEKGVLVFVDGRPARLQMGDMIPISLFRVRLREPPVPSGRG